MRKGAYYLARIIYLKHKSYIDQLAMTSSAQERKADVARKFMEDVDQRGRETFDYARKTFERALRDYLKAEGGNEDAALKNSKFAKMVDQVAKS